MHGLLESSEQGLSLQKIPKDNEAFDTCHGKWAHSFPATWLKSAINRVRTEKLPKLLRACLGRTTALLAKSLWSRSHCRGCSTKRYVTGSGFTEVRKETLGELHSVRGFAFGVQSLPLCLSKLQVIALYQRNRKFDLALFPCNMEKLANKHKGVPFGIIVWLRARPVGH